MMFAEGSKKGSSSKRTTKSKTKRRLKGAEEMIQWVRRLLCNHTDVSSDPQDPCKKTKLVAQQ